MILLQHLATVPDPRRAQGRRYPRLQMPAMVIMAAISDHYGYLVLDVDYRASVGY